MLTRFLRLTGLGLLSGLSVLTAADPAVKVTIIYDNYQTQAGLETDWGFACLVENRGEKLLFDAGRKTSLFRENAEKLGIRPQEIPAFFLSHSHGDHTAGIPWITQCNPSIQCYFPASYVAEMGSSVTLPSNCRGCSEPGHLHGSFYTTGDDFELFHEQGLVIKLESGGVLVTGCGHPGVVEMVRRARETMGIEVHTVIGGLHLLEMTDEQVRMIAVTLKEMGIRTICPTHCTGERAIALLSESFGKGYIPGGTGSQISIE